MNRRYKELGGYVGHDDPICQFPEHSELRSQLAAMTVERDNYRNLYHKDLIRANEDNDALRDKLTAMTEERNHLRSLWTLERDALTAMTEERDALRAEWHRAEEVSGEYQAKLTASEAHSENLSWSLLYAMAERDDALWMLGRIDKGIRGCVGNWYQAVCYASAMCERALAGSKRIKEDE